MCVREGDSTEREIGGPPSLAGAMAMGEMGAASLSLRLLVGTVSYLLYSTC